MYIPKTFFIRNLFLGHRLRLLALYLVILALTILTTYKVFAHKTANDLNNHTALSAKSFALYDVLVAEIAASRQLNAVALHYYQKAMADSDNPDVAKAATLLAISAESPQMAIESAIIWAKEDPQNIEAQMIAMTLLINQSSDKAVPYLETMIELNPAQTEQSLIDIQSRLSEASAKNLNKALIQIASKQPNNPYALFMAAQSAIEERNVPQAIKWVDAALKNKPDFTSAIELKARLIRYTENADEPALAFIEDKLRQFPANGELRFFYANALFDANQLEAGKKQLEKLTTDPIQAGLALLALSDFYLREGNPKTAITLLEKALRYPKATNAAEYLWAEAEIQKGDLNEAIKHFSNITEGPYQVPAVLKTVELLAEKKQFSDAIELIHNTTPTTFEEQKQLLVLEIELLNSNKDFEGALELCNEIIAKLPKDADFLFLRAMTEINLKKWNAAESDLNAVLKEDPNHAHALNALGYTLTFDEKRKNEAIHYISQALNLDPKNAFFIDTLGWAYYQLGSLEKSIEYLTDAFKMSKNPKIAAHLGEVLWLNNQKTEAKAIFETALQEHENNEEIRETMERLNVKGS